MTIIPDTIYRCPENEVIYKGEERLLCSKICKAKYKCRNCIYLKKICQNCGWKTDEIYNIKICEKCGNDKFIFNYKRVGEEQ